MRLRVCFLTAIFFAAWHAPYGQQPPPSRTPVLYSDRTLSELRQLQRAALSSDYAYKQTAALSYNIGPRPSGSAQAQHAVEYVASEMRKLGLDVRLQKIMVPRWVRGEETAQLIEYAGMAPRTTQKVVVTALAGSIATPAEGLRGEIVVVSNFDELNHLGREKVQGKIVLFNFKFDRELQASGYGLSAYGQAVQYRSAGPSAAARLGAIGVLVRSAGGSQNRLAHTGALRYAEGVNRIPAGAITFEDAEMIEFLSRRGPVRMRMTLTPQTLPDVESHNVIADLKGSDRPDEIVIVSGHLDSWDLGQGAIDDASGVAVSMQVPYLLKQLNLKPKRTIRFIAWMDEEFGGRGSAAYAEEQKHNTANHFAALESDLGASHPVGFVFAGKPEALPFLAPISSVLLSQGAGLSQIQPGVGADIAPLTRRGVPSFAPWFNQQTYFNYHHTATDTFDKIDPKHLAEAGSVMAVLAYGLANLERPLPR